jgi:hypothetical protein
MRCSASLRVARGAFKPMQNLVALIHARARLLFARKAHGVVKVADDSSVPKMQLRREIEVDAHTRAMTRSRKCSRSGQAMLLSHNILGVAERVEMKLMHSLATPAAVTRGLVPRVPVHSEDNRGRRDKPGDDAQRVARYEWEPL